MVVGEVDQVDSLAVAITHLLTEGECLAIGPFRRRGVAPFHVDGGKDSERLRLPTLIVGFDAQVEGGLQLIDRLVVLPVAEGRPQGQAGFGLLARVALVDL